MRVIFDLGYMLYILLCLDKYVFKELTDTAMTGNMENSAS